MAAAPATALQRAADELAAAILPRMLGHLREQTAEFEALARRIERWPERTLADETALATVESVQAQSQGVGWCLGVVAAASGADLLLARRERDGLRHMLTLVSEALAGHPFRPEVEALPTLSTTEGEGWEVPFLVAYLFLCAGARLPRGAPLRWSLIEAAGRVRLRFPEPVGDARLAERLAALLALVPGAALEHDAETCELVFPAAWLAPA